MNYYEVAPTKIFRAGGDILTYESDQTLPPGTIVLIPLGKTTIPGLIIKKVKKPDFPTKPITKTLYPQPLPSHLIKSLPWLSTYYACPLPTVLQTALPRGIEKQRRAESPSGNSSEHSVSPVKKSGLPSSENLSERSELFSELDAKKTFLHTRANTGSEELSVEIPLNDAQHQAISKINSCKSNTVLLYGITGSGKTNIYLELTRQTLSNQKSVIVLVPEIALTSQLIQDFQQHFTNITLLHSKQTEATRHLAWQNILKNNQPQIIIGPRSALFAPVQNLGLIVIDEAHEPAYHQDQAPKYSAVRLASMMSRSTEHELQLLSEEAVEEMAAGHLLPAERQRLRPVKTGAHAKCLLKKEAVTRVLLGTATPTIADYYLATQQNALVTLNELAIKNQTTTSTAVADLKDRTNFKKHRLISDQLISAIQNSLDHKTQTMIFHNRRGSAPLTICDHCGWQALCPHCLLPQNLHVDHHALLCHTCGQATPVPTDCPNCHHANILHKGFGTKLLETELNKLFPNAKIARFDADTQTQESLVNTYDAVKSGHVDIIIGTQMIAKGFDLPKLTTLGVIQADAGLALPDFSSEERTFQLLTQVIGRANRGHQNTQIIIQTYQPDHPVIKFGTTADYANLYKYLISHRQRSSLPPYSYLLKLTLTYKTEEACIRNIQKLREEIENLQKPLSISAPTPAFHEHTPRGFSWQLIIKSKSRAELLKIIQNLKPNPYLQIHLDPPSLL